MCPKKPDAPGVPTWGFITGTTAKAIFVQLALKDGTILESQSLPKSTVENVSNVNFEKKEVWQVIQIAGWKITQLVADVDSLLPATSPAPSNTPPPTVRGAPTSQSSSQPSSSKPDIPGVVFDNFEKMDSMQTQAMEGGQILGEFFYQQTFKDKKTGKTSKKTAISAYGTQSIYQQFLDSDNPICFGPHKIDEAADAFYNLPGQPKLYACIMVPAWFKKTPESVQWGTSSEPVGTDPSKYRFVVSTAASKARRNATLALMDPAKKLMAIKAYEAMLAKIKTPALNAPKEIILEAENLQLNNGTTIINADIEEPVEPTEADIAAQEQSEEEMKEQEKKKFKVDMPQKPQKSPVVPAPQATTTPPMPQATTVTPKPQQTIPLKTGGETIVPEVEHFDQPTGPNWKAVIDTMKATVLHKDEEAQKALENIFDAEILTQIRKLIGPEAFGERDAISLLQTGATKSKSPTFLNKVIENLQQAINMGKKRDAALQYAVMKTMGWG